MPSLTTPRRTQRGVRRPWPCCPRQIVRHTSHLQRHGGDLCSPPSPASSAALRGHGMRKLWLRPASEATPRQPVVVDRSNRCENVAVTVMHMEKLSMEWALEKTRVTSASSISSCSRDDVPLGLRMVLGPFGVRAMAHRFVAT
jgi:hypothetical protein